MAAWKKRFERWQNATSPVEVERVENLLRRVFGERLSIAEGTSHRFHLDVSELVGRPGWVLPTLPIPVRGGQKVLPVYLQRAFEAADLLGLYPPEDEETQDEESSDDEDY